MWLTRSLSKKPLTMTLGLVSSAYSGFLGIQSDWILTFLVLEGGMSREELELPTGQETLTALRDGDGRGEGVGGVGGCWVEGRNGNFYILINFKKRKKKRARESKKKTNRI